MKTKATPYTVAALAIAALLAGFLLWRDAPDTVKLGGAIVAVILSALPSVLAGDAGDGPKTGALSVLGAVLVLSVASACTTSAKILAAEDAFAVAACVATTDGPLEAVIAKCARDNVSPDDIRKLFEAREASRSAGCAGAKAGPKDAGADR